MPQVKLPTGPRLKVTTISDSAVGTVTTVTTVASVTSMTNLVNIGSVQAEKNLMHPISNIQWAETTRNRIT